jgi:hypothetical protein
MEALTFDHDNQDPFLDLEYTIQGLHFAIKNFRVQSSPRRGGIYYLIICNLSTEALENMLEIYNDILKASVFPGDWKAYTELFIPKTDKTNERLISMASCVCKVLERVINMRISWWLEKNQKFSATQYGFRRKKRCTDNLAILTIAIKKLWGPLRSKCASQIHDFHRVFAFLDYCVNFVISV